MWFDTIYLAKFPAISPLDIKLLSEQRPNILTTVNSFYQSKFELRIPLNLKSGTYFIVYVADSLRVTNDLDFDNNQNFIQIEVRQQPTADVFVQNVSLTSSTDLNSNKIIGFDWWLGANIELDAYRCDSYYLVTDAPASMEHDFFMRTTVEIASGFCKRFVIRRLGVNNALELLNEKKNIIDVPLVLEGKYLGMVKSISNVAETNFENNMATSAETVDIVVDELILNEERETNIEMDGKKLFKFVPNYALNAFKVTLTTSSLMAYNDIFIGDNRQVPSENTFKAKSKIPFSFNQTAVMRNAKPSVYYILVKSFLGSSSASAGSMNYSIVLKVQEIKDIDVNFVYPIQMSTLGSTTFKFSGTFLTKNLNV
jgi:hypothetical protein